MKNNAKLILHIFACVLITGCLIVPTPEHSDPVGQPIVRNVPPGQPKGIIETAIPETEIKKLKPGKIEREDILLQFGDPTFRLEDDHIFMYCWQRIAGYAFLFLFDIYGNWFHTHLLCLEFSDDNKLIRLDHLHFAHDYDKQKGIRTCRNILDWEEPALLEWLPPNS